MENYNKKENDIIRDSSWLGRFHKLHRIGQYRIIELIDENKHKFITYVNYKSTSHSFNNLDWAIAYCIAYKIEGCGTQSYKYFMQGLKRQRR